ncbi:Alpha/beta hydrolase family protein [Pseudovibrio axinellae]|uniref:Alpha/beta hydrolase family protein n=1 Tax=Pseudovibrio axinellae TaxID=989403 RepID=A0A161UZL9_9HYPH|nr:dienelactone hydrolase [Pseudovibrio axinellae]KZL06690.1 Alpha/beta hydrolase family protein [Pseudovibrio axinellae]SER60825.1 Predicted dienelactone hydrolase [Pseudovibrio axinellae]
MTSLQKVVCLTALIGALPVGAVADNRIDGQRPDAPELAAYGEHTIGVRTLEFTHANQVEILALDPGATKPLELPRYDRPLTVEFWYPAQADSQGSTTLQTYLRDGKTQVELEGKAHRDAVPAGGAYPLVLISHGYPGNRYLLAHLAENLASMGYVVASIDHKDSTYRDKAAFGSTLVNRSLDQVFVLNEIERLSKDDDFFLTGQVDTSSTGLVGYSMGGYGAVITAGGGVTQQAVDLSWGAPHGTLGVHLAGSESHGALIDPRIKTAVAFAPWGRARDFWDADGLKGVQIPMLFVAGSQDDVSGYEDGVRKIWEEASSVDRALLTYEHANHNAGAPMPAPVESYKYDDDIGFNVSEHYIDAVWDSVRMNNVAQHFVTAWMGHYIKGEEDKAGYLDLVASSNNGVWSKEEDGSFSSEHTYWKGFSDRTAKGLRFEWLKASK